MLRYLAIVGTLSMSACAEYQAGGTGLLEGEATEFVIREHSKNGLILDGWLLIANGEELGVLKFDGKPAGPISRKTTQFKPLRTRYGVFDGQHVRNVSAAGLNDVFTITLDGKYVGTVSGST